MAKAECARRDASDREGDDNSAPRLGSRAAVGCGFSSCAPPRRAVSAIFEILGPAA